MAIIFLSCGFFFLSSIIFFFSSSLFSVSRRRLDVYHTFTCTWSGHVNLECRPETCCTRLAENTGCKKSPENSPSAHHPQLCRAISSQLRHVSTIVKSVLNSGISPTSAHNMVNFGPLAAELFSSLGHPSEFQRVSRLGSITVYGTLVVGVSQTLRR